MLKRLICKMFIHRAIYYNIQNITICKKVSTMNIPFLVYIAIIIHGCLHFGGILNVKPIPSFSFIYMQA